MRRTIVIGALMALLLGFAGNAFAGERWIEPLVRECKEAAVAAPEQVDAGALADPLDQALFLSGQTCSTVANCLCPYEPACYCTSAKRCICNYNICCPGGECS
jgi:hypothetical protein